MLTLLNLYSALAAPPPPPWEEPVVPEPTVRLALRGLIETWEDGSLGTVYKTGMVAPGVGAVVPITGRLALDLEGGYRKIRPRDEGLDASVELIPMAATVQFDLIRDPGWSWFAGVGPSLMVFSERHPQNKAGGVDGAQVVRGARLGVDVRTGARIDTGLIQPSRIPGIKRPSGLDLEFTGARRFTRPGLEGFNLGAWRLGVGVAFRM